MSQALQCTQFAALICSRFRRARQPPSRKRPPDRSARTDCRIPGRSARRRCSVSATFRWTGWLSSCALPAKNTNETRSRGGSVRSTQCRSGEVVLIEFRQPRPVGRVLQGPGRLAGREHLPGGVDEPEPQAALERRLEVADALQLLSAGGSAPAGVEAAAVAGLRDVLAGQRAGADRLVHALDLGEVQRAARVADQHRARHFQRRRRLPAAGGDGARPGRDDLPALEQRLDARVVLVLLERLERLQARVLIVQADDVADVHAIVIEVVQEAAGVGVRVRRPPEGVFDASRAARARPAAATAPCSRARRSAGSARCPARSFAISCLETEPRQPSASTVTGAWISTPGVKFGPGLAVAIQAHVADPHALDRARLHQTAPPRRQSPGRPRPRSLPLSAPATASAGRGRR